MNQTQVISNVSYSLELTLRHFSRADMKNSSTSARRILAYLCRELLLQSVSVHDIHNNTSSTHKYRRAIFYHHVFHIEDKSVAQHKSTQT